MSTNFPTSLDALTNPTATDKVSTVGHAAQHANVNDAIEAIQAKLGVNSSAVTTSHDYKLSGVTGSDKAASLAGTEAFTNKTLTSPILTTPRFADLGYIADANGNELLIFDTVTSAVNEIVLANAATGTNPKFTASGGDSNIGFDFQTKGTGVIRVLGSSTQAGEIRFYEDTDDGSNYTALKAGAPSGDVTYTLPATAPSSSGQILSATTGGVMSWVANTAIQTTTSAMPQPDFAYTAVGALGVVTNTTGHFGRVTLSAPITAAKLSFTVSLVSVAGTLKVALFSEDGQTQYISFTTANISGTGLVTTSFTGVSLSAGIYYIAIVPVGTADITCRCYTVTGNATDFTNPAGEPLSCGTLTVTASTMPATFSPTALTVGTTDTIVIRLDN